MRGTVLVTGGAGYVGSHVVVALVRAGFDAIVLDNFANSSDAVLPVLRKLTGAGVPLITADVRDRVALAAAFASRRVDAVIHCAGLKAVAEGEAKPLLYYDNNVGGTLALLRTMDQAGVKTLVFSSSATVYGQPDTNPVAENAPLRPASVYGRTKRAIELILEDLAASDSSWSVALLRYFNPAGADESGQIGEAPSGTPNNLVPILGDVAAHRRQQVEIFGTDYPTPDGTAIRDYIHIEDLAAAHLLALDAAREGEHKILNLGNGSGFSVREVIATAEQVTGRPIPTREAPRRPGDPPQLVAGSDRIRRELGWVPHKPALEEMVADAWAFAQAHPHGYRAAGNA